MKMRWNILFLALLPHLLSAQPDIYAYDWHAQDPARPWVGLAVAADGLYQVSLGDLLAAGYDPGSAPASSLRLYYRGEEQRLHLLRDAQGDWVAIEFLGRRRDAADEATMYFDAVTGAPAPQQMPDPGISIFGDTAVYFLTWGGGGSGLRYASSLDTAYSQQVPLSSLPVEAVREYPPDSSESIFVRGGGGAYDPFYNLNCDYVVGEGYVGPSFAIGVSRQQTLATPFPANTAPARLHVRLFGASYTTHAPRVQFNNQSGYVLDTAFLINEVYVRTFERTVAGPVLPVNTLTFSTSNVGGATDMHHVCRIAVRYDRLPVMAGSSLTIDAWDLASPAYMRLTQATGSDSAWIYDAVAGVRHGGVLRGDTVHVRIPGVPTTRDLYLYTDAARQRPHIRPARMQPLCHPDSGAAFVIIAERSLAASAQAYAAYRRVAAPNAHTVRVVFTDELYDAFGYGSYTPLAIRRFIDCARTRWQQPPQFVLLWGKGGYQPRTDLWPLVPTWGYPADDYALVSPMTTDASRLRPQVPVGRLAIVDNTTGLAYLGKVAAFEYGGWAPWRQRGLFLGGGVTLGEQTTIGQSIQYFIDRFEASAAQGQATYFQAGSTAQPGDTVSIAAHIDSGQSLLVLVGHSTQNLFDMPLPDPDNVQNGMRLPLMMLMGSRSGDFTTDLPAVVERWLARPDGGAIACLANSAAGYLTPLVEYGQFFFDEMFLRSAGMPIGQVVQRTFIAYIDSLVGIQFRNHSRQMNLQGDPSLVLFPPVQPASGLVWPGDTDDDGVVTVADLLPVGLIYGKTGPARALPSIAWAAQYGIPWAGGFPDGTGHQHADADGDGIVSYADTLAIVHNYGLGSGTPQGSGAAGGMPVVVLVPDSANAGDTVTIGLWLGSSGTQPDSIYGIALILQLDTAQVIASSSRVDFAASWLGTPGTDLMVLTRYDSLTGQLALAMTRTDHQARFGTGALATISIVITDDIAKRSWETLRVGLVFGKALRASGQRVLLSGLSTSIAGHTAPLLVRAWPNPAEDVLTLALPEPIDWLEVVDVGGRRVYTAQALPGGEHRIDMRTWSPGMYTLRVRRGLRQAALRIVAE